MGHHQPSGSAARWSRVNDLVSITGIAVGGDGVGRLGDGRVVFIPRAAPGDQVRLREDSLERHRNFARAEVGAIVHASRARVAPPCPHYVNDHCGDCQLQHVAYEGQLSAKRAIVGDALRRIGKLKIEDPEIVEALEEWRYRSKISMAAKALAVGLHPYDRPNFVFPLADCHITDFKLMALWRELRSRLSLLPERLTRLTLRLDREGRSRVVAGPETGFPATAFEQVNPGMGMLTRQWAVEQLGDVRAQTVWDLYGGIGDTAALLVERGASVISVDVDEKAVTWARTRLPAVRFIAARAEDVLPSLPAPYAVVVNPPRAGLHWDVTLRLTGEPVAKLVYISGDPATLARDLQRLNVNYQVIAVRAFDLFPQTAHVETVAVLEAA